MMGSFGRFLEISVPAADVLRSLNFYRALGFGELPAGDIRPWHYAVVTDGAIVIGLHGGGLAEPALCFVRPNLARQVHALEAAGLDFESCRLGEDEFHEATLRSPDGLLLMMIEARTFSPGAAAATGASLIGRCAEVALDCADPSRTRAFFEAAGFLEAGGDDATTRLDYPGLRLELREAARAEGMALRYSGTDAATLTRRLEAQDFRISRGPGGPLLRAPEGTRLLLG
jgi:catechol 2,3-dioxygenase-like lactoylglutathione lyase family enzyme